MLSSHVNPYFLFLFLFLKIYKNMGQKLVATINIKKYYFFVL